MSTLGWLIGGGGAALAVGAFFVARRFGLKASTAAIIGGVVFGLSALKAALTSAKAKGAASQQAKVDQANADAAARAKEALAEEQAWELKNPGAVRPDDPFNRDRWSKP